MVERLEAVQRSARRAPSVACAIPFAAPSRTTENSAPPHPPYRTVPPAVVLTLPSEDATDTRAPGHAHHKWPPSTENAVTAA